MANNISKWSGLLLLFGLLMVILNCTKKGDGCTRDFEIDIEVDGKVFDAIPDFCDNFGDTLFTIQIVERNGERNDAPDKLVIGLIPFEKGTYMLSNNPDDRENPIGFFIVFEEENSRLDTYHSDSLSVVTIHTVDMQTKILELSFDCNFLVRDGTTPLNAKYGNSIIANGEIKFHFD